MVKSSGNLWQGNMFSLATDSCLDPISTCSKQCHNFSGIMQFHNSHHFHYPSLLSLSFRNLSLPRPSKSPDSSFGPWECFFMFPPIINVTLTDRELFLCDIIYIFLCVIYNHHFEPGCVTVIVPNVWHTLLLFIVIIANLI